MQSRLRTPFAKNWEPDRISNEDSEPCCVMLQGINLHMRRDVGGACRICQDGARVRMNVPRGGTLADYCCCIDLKRDLYLDRLHDKAPEPVWEKSPQSGGGGEGRYVVTVQTCAVGCCNVRESSLSCKG